MEDFDQLLVDLHKAIDAYGQGEFDLGSRITEPLTVWRQYSTIATSKLKAVESLLERVRKAHDAKGESTNGNA